MESGFYRQHSECKNISKRHLILYFFPNWELFYCHELWIMPHYNKIIIYMK